MTDKIEARIKRFKSAWDETVFLKTGALSIYQESEHGTVICEDVLIVTFLIG